MYMIKLVVHSKNTHMTYHAFGEYSVVRSSTLMAMDNALARKRSILIQIIQAPAILFLALYKNTSTLMTAVITVTKPSTPTLPTAT